MRQRPAVQTVRRAGEDSPFFAEERIQIRVSPGARSKFRNDDHVGAMVEDGAEVRWTVAQARITVDALQHLDAKRHVLPLLVTRPRLDAFGPCRPHDANVGEWKRPTHRHTHRLS